VVLAVVANAPSRGEGRALPGLVARAINYVVAPSIHFAALALRVRDTKLQIHELPPNALGNEQLSNRHNPLEPTGYRSKNHSKQGSLQPSMPACREEAVDEIYG